MVICAYVYVLVVSAECGSSVGMIDFITLTLSFPR